jgi:Na+/melibiose symporter-like transporter
VITLIFGLLGFCSIVAAVIALLEEFADKNVLVAFGASSGFVACSILFFAGMQSSLVLVDIADLLADSGRKSGDNFR